MLRLEFRDVVEVIHAVGASREVDEQQMPPMNRAFDTWNEGDRARARVLGDAGGIELFVMQRDGEGAETKLCSAVDHIERRVRNPVERVVSRVNVQVDLDHPSSVPRQAAVQSRQSDRICAQCC